MEILENFFTAPARHGTVKISCRGTAQHGTAQIFAICAAARHSTAQISPIFGKISKIKNKKMSPSDPE